MDSDSAGDGSFVAKAHITGDEWARGGFRVVAVGWVVAALVVALRLWHEDIGAGVIADCHRPIVAYAAELALAACGVALALRAASREMAKKMALLGIALIVALWLPAAFALPTAFTAVCDN
jgi:hypothetical protein